MASKTAVKVWISRTGRAEMTSRNDKKVQNARSLKMFRSHKRQNQKKAKLPPRIILDVSVLFRR